VKLEVTGGWENLLAKPFSNEISSTDADEDEPPSPSARHRPGDRQPAKRKEKPKQASKAQDRSQKKYTGGGAGERWKVMNNLVDFTLRNYPRTPKIVENTRV